VADAQGDGTERDRTALGEPASRQRTIVIARVVLRAVLTATVLVVLYYVLPMNHVASAGSVLLLAAGLIAIAALLTWRIRGITVSAHPGLRAIETLALVVPLYVLAFATTYYLAARSNGATFSEPITRTDALYFSVTIFATVGFGDITAKTEAARLVVTAQMFIDLILLGFGARVFVSAVQLGRRRQDPHKDQ
jgi:voltage-gated potassium channel